MDISVVIPLYNEEESLPELNDWLARVLNGMGHSYEVIYVDDGSTDTSWMVIESLIEADVAHVKGIKLRGNQGKSQALRAGFHDTCGRVVFTMDADLQDSPDELPVMYSMITDQGYDLVSGWKQKRYDPLSKTIPTKLFNYVARKASGLTLHDFNCGLKAYRCEVVKAIDIYGEMHRYVPMLAQQAGFRKIGEKVVHHRARKYGHSKFGIERFFNGMLDMISIVVLRRFGRSPMHFFGTLGFFMFVIGFFSAAYIGINKLYMLYQGYKTILVTDNPWFYIMLTMMLLGVQFFMAGFIGEMIVKNRQRVPDYYLEKEKNINNN
ncbi:MAG: glycosyltransferase family 2 protein [Flavobacteriales bacterium]|nr:glycosyltransferase family 2 protein [Flavobacteriales bacterium]